MTNYVIINGTNSNTITGLAINELPPITKPLMRTTTDEIDGRDGDIITKLGYSAYDKTITIGLWGTGYDVNDIISFFTSEGTITFSNEPDKYYKFTMLEQIDVESLLRFKTASITFHCQPFKYPLEEEPLEIEYQYVSGNGESITLNNTGESILKLDTRGQCKQDGEPTPDAPQQIHVVSGDNTIRVEDKNLIGLTTNQYKVFLKAGDVIRVTNQTSSPLKLDCFTNYGDETKYDYWNCNANQGRTITIGQDTRAIAWEVAPDGLAWINRGDTSLDYSVYQGSQTYPINLGTLELCKIGDYQDYFTKNSDGQWCKYNAIGKVVLDGSESWGSASSPTGTARFYYDNATYYNSGLTRDDVYALSPQFKGLTWANIYSGDTTTKNAIALYDSQNKQGRLVLRIDNTYANSVATFKTWLSTHNTIVYYVLNTPYLSLIENETLISQLNALESAMSYKGQTNISQTNNDLPFYLIASAMKQNSNEVVVNNIGNATSKPLIALEGTGNINIYLDGTQMLKATLTDKMTIDTNNLEAYNPDTMTLLNRQLVGDISKFTLASGNNTIKVDGNLTKATITNYTRWL